MFLIIKISIFKIAISWIIVINRINFRTAISKIVKINNKKNSYTYIIFHKMHKRTYTFFRIFIVL